MSLEMLVGSSAATPESTEEIPGLVDEHILLADRVSLPLLALFCATTMFVPALAALRVSENPHPHLAARPLFAELFLDLKDLLWSKKNRDGIAFSGIAGRRRPMTDLSTTFTATDSIPVAAIARSAARSFCLPPRNARSSAKTTHMSPKSPSADAV